MNAIRHWSIAVAVLLTTSAHAQSTERLRRTDFGHMEIEFTFDDPKTFTKPWSTTVKFNLLPDTDLLEFHCDNEKWSDQSKP